MSMSEILTIMVIFHLSGYRTFKHFYIFYVQKHMQNWFLQSLHRAHADKYAAISVIYENMLFEGMYRNIIYRFYSYQSL